MAKKKESKFDVERILQNCAELRDPRSHVNQRHLLGDIVVIRIMVIIAGEDGPKFIGVWAISNQHWLQDRLELPNGIPSHDTIGRVLMALNLASFQTCSEFWIKRLSGKRAEGKLDIVAIDGKSLRRSHDRAAGLGPRFLVSAWAVRRGTSLGQLGMEGKSNEITVIPDFLDQIDIHRCDYRC